MKKIVFTVLASCLLFYLLVMGFDWINRFYNRENHLQAMNSVFCEIYGYAERFLTDEENQKSFIRYLKKETSEKEMKYLVGRYNVDAPVKLSVMLTDAEGDLAFSSFYPEALNLHRMEFNRIAAENGKKKGKGIYQTVYYLSGDASEYVMSKPLYENGRYAGSICVYMDGREWGPYFSEYQYDVIITNGNNDIIYCSNRGFLPERNANKYRPEGGDGFVRIGDSRYQRSARTLPDMGIKLYSFIYAPENYIYLASGIGMIVLLGGIWLALSLQMMRTMVTKTSRSVDMLAGEIRVIREGDAAHVIKVQTGDEIEEIAGRINEMMESIRELNARNLELATINSRMELENLQAQLNPHFIYNTLDTIKYLIMQEPARAEELLTRFTRILRYSINNGKSRVTLREDMEYIEDYLVIQKTRFGNRFSYSIDLGEACMDLMVPKLLLEPLLENSIKYGFRKKPSIRIEIEGHRKDGYLYLEVADNGAGVPKSTLETLENMIRRGDGAHIGLQSISRLIRLEYGRESGLELQSIDGEEFRVLLKLWVGGEEHVSGAFGRG